MNNMETKNLPATYQEICTFCYPDNWEVMRDTVGSHILDKNGHYIGGFTPAKDQELRAIENKFNEGKFTTCVCLDDVAGVFACKKHLLEIAEKM